MQNVEVEVTVRVGPLTKPAETVVTQVARKTSPNASPAAVGDAIATALQQAAGAARAGVEATRREAGVNW